MNCSITQPYPFLIYFIKSTLSFYAWVNYPNGYTKTLTIECGAYNPFSVTVIQSPEYPDNPTPQ